MINVSSSTRGRGVNSPCDQAHNAVGGLVRDDQYCFFFYRQQEHVKKAPKKEGLRPTYIGYIHKNKPNTPQTKKDHTNKTKQS